MAANGGFEDGSTVSRRPRPGTAQGMIPVILVLEAVVLRSEAAPTCWLGWRRPAHPHSMGVDWEKRPGREEEGLLPVTRTSAYYGISGWKVCDEGPFRRCWGCLDAEEEDGLKAPTGRVGRIERDR